MPKPLGQFFITDAFTTPNGWKLSPGQISTNAVVYVNNQSPQEFTIWGNGVNYLGSAPAWISYWKFTMDLVYTFVEFRPTMSLNPLGPPALYVNGIVFESYEPDPHWQPIAVVRQIDQARQVRSVMVPMGLSHVYGGQWAVGDPSPLVLQTSIVSPAQLAAGYAPVYLYYAQITPTSSTTDQMAFNVELQWRTSGGVAVGGPFVMARGAVLDNVTNKTSTPWIFAPVWPCAGVGPFPATAAKADFQLTFISGGRMTCHYTVAVGMDPSNVIGDSDIGTQAIYNAANPTANPYF